jgi:hypothetical protein
MIFVPRDATDEQVLDIAHHWIDVLAREDYTTIFQALGYSLLYQCDCPGPECIRNTIKHYRSPEFYPGVEDFTVTNWRTATGGNQTPIKKITWYKPNDTGLRGALAIHLPLNGKWSDLLADFIWFENKNLNEGFGFRLEEIGSVTQQQREYENAP